MSRLLKASEEATLRTADPKQIVSALAALVLPNGGKWLPSSHAAVRGIEREHRPLGALPISALALAEYLAIAAPSHCADGWSYLSRALHSYLTGDAHSAWHFAYYAELRAAQSILSGVGCGAFNSWNCVLDATGGIHSLGSGGTHDMVWLMLHYLVENSPAGALAIADATKVLGISLPDIVQAAYPGRSVVATSASWINDWLFDLQAGAGDKSFRNQCSYSPHLVTPHRASLGECVELMSDLWEALAPTPGAAFLEIDKMVVRSALREVAIESLTLKSGGATPTHAEVEGELLQAHARIIGTFPLLAVISAKYLANAATSEHPLLVHSRDRSLSPDTPRPVLARATLLLRIASGTTRNLLASAGHSGSVDFWLGELAERQGLVNDTSEMPPNRDEFYLDCAVASEDLEREFTQGRTSLKSIVSCSVLNPLIAAQVERVVQWGLAP